MTEGLDRTNHRGPWLAKCDGLPSIVITGDRWAEEAHETAMQAYADEGASPANRRSVTVEPITEARAAESRATSQEAAIADRYRAIDAAVP